MAASFLGPAGVSLSLPATAIVAGPDAGPPQYRHRAVVLTYVIFLAMTPLAVFAGGAATVLPLELLVAIAGLAVIGVLAMAMKRISSGPLTLGPLIAFAVAVSDLSIFGLGPYFWSLVLGWLCHGPLSEKVSRRSAFSRGSCTPEEAAPSGCPAL